MTIRSPGLPTREMVVHGNQFVAVDARRTSWPLANGCRSFGELGLEMSNTSMPLGVLT